MNWIDKIKAFFKRIKAKHRARKNNMRLVRARNLIKDVCKDELPGNLIEHEGKKYMIEDVTLSIRHNRLHVHKKRLEQALAEKDKLAMAAVRSLKHKQ